MNKIEALRTFLSLSLDPEVVTERNEWVEAGLYHQLCSMIHESKETYSKEEIMERIKMGQQF